MIGVAALSLLVGGIGVLYFGAEWLVRGLAIVEVTLGLGLVLRPLRALPPRASFALASAVSLVWLAFFDFDSKCGCVGRLLAIHGGPKVALMSVLIGGSYLLVRETLPRRGPASGRHGA